MLNKKNRPIYLDYAATTPVDPKVIEVMLPYFNQQFGNTKSIHSFGMKAQEILDQQREIIAKSIKADSKEIIFTSSATESNNLALKGIAWSNQDKGNHIIISQIEHPCILESAQWLEKQGFQITYVAPDNNGFISSEKIERLITKKTILVSIIYASNEIGTIQPIKEIGKICKNQKVYFHTDAVQAFDKIPINVNQMNIDLLTASSHKIYGPKGVACLFIKQGVKITPLLHGGGHEFGFRSSTVNLPAIVGFAKAVQISQKQMKKENKRLAELRDKTIQAILKKIPKSHLNGHSFKRLSNNIHFRFDFVEGEALLMYLDNLGIAVSTGSACASKKLEPNYVLKAIGLKPVDIHGSLRISLGRWTTDQDIEYLVESLVSVIAKLRKISPFKIKPKT